ncbi:phytanoyl-CoA dioxygenase family protein [Oceanicoccus sagamiensis]|uniref:phytanoyl-CoA dioxygenase family protein n=1 Tax=Oceanicoccus sagamiensis TaxID=716816 RepID=UPI000A26E91C|nr:phytanoyl-CoA dioxygenase family protein [Oceanicoccus sagamiensis]
MPALEDGYEIIGEFLSHDQLVAIISEIESIELPAKVGGIRNAEKKFSSIRELANSEKLRIQAKKYLSGKASLVRAILFNKTTENNWLVTWHQDRTIAVSERFERNQWGPWSVKDGIHHVQPSVDALNQMITFRIHLDDTSQENGCLKILPKSQKLGILDHGSIQDYVQNHNPIICEALAGSVLVMRPHILHSSSKASNPSQRRVLHLEYSSFKLPPGVAWA